jgi:hypothetical protein
MSAPKPKTTITGGKPLWYSPIGKRVCSLMLSALITYPCLSQTIGYWNFNSTLAGAGSGAHNTLSTADFNSGIPTKLFNGGLEYVGQDGWPTGGINTGAYFQFSISPNTGYQLDLTSVFLRIRRSNTGSPQGAGPTTWSLRSSLDGYASDIASNSLTHNYSNFSVPLSGFLNIYTTVTFRLYGYDVTINSGGTSKLVIDSINIQGIGVVLPVSITGVQALHNDDKNVSVKWQVTNVHEGSVFNVERSVNGTDFTTINRFPESETKSTGSYSYEDSRVPGDAEAVFYRIKINEPGGWTYFSWLVKVNNKTIQQALVDYATIQGQSVLTSLQVPEKGIYTVSLISMHGAVLQQQSLNLDAGVHVLTLPLNIIAHGTYVVRLSGNRQLSSKKFVW